MWESPESVWLRLKLGREEYLQRLLTTLIVGGDPPRWNTPSRPTEQGQRFLQLLDDLAHGDELARRGPVEIDAFIDEYLLPKLEDFAQNAGRIGRSGGGIGSGSSNSRPKQAATATTSCPTTYVWLRLPILTSGLT